MDVQENASPLRISNLYVARQLTFSTDSTREKSEGKVDVFLRIKPLDVKTVDDRLNDNHFSVDGNILRTKYKRARDEVTSKYEFVNICMPTTSQTEIYRTIVMPLFKLFLLGQDALIFSFGTSNSGKSYTIQGTATAPGIIPRFLHWLFQSTQDCLESMPQMYPSKSDDVEYASESFTHNLENRKQKMIDTISEYLANFDDSISSAEISEMSSRFSECPFILKEEGVCISIFISFAEVYNEKVYDLLVDPNDKRPLRLGFDHRQNYFIKDLTHFSVNSWEEAFALYKCGRKNLQVSATAMNMKSSRSHGIFSIKLMKRPVNEPNKYFDITTFTICDLAGTERANATQNKGMRLKESTNINVSLSTLHRCFMAMKANQNKQEKDVPPFRESKLTCLFKKYLLGQGGKISMIANMSQASDLFQETSHILKTSALVYKTKIATVKPPSENLPPLKQRFSMYRSQANTAVQEERRQPNTFVVPAPPACSGCKVLEERNAKLTAKNEELEEERITLKGELLSAQRENSEQNYEEALSRWQDKYTTEAQKHKVLQRKIADHFEDLAKAAKLPQPTQEHYFNSFTALVVKQLEHNAYVVNLAEEEIGELKGAITSLLEKVKIQENAIATKDGENLEMKSQIDELNGLLAAKTALPAKDGQEEESEQGASSCRSEESEIVPTRKAKTVRYVIDSSSDDSIDFTKTSKNALKGVHVPDDSPDDYQLSKQNRPLSVRKMRKKKKDVELPNLGRLSISDSSLPTLCHSEPPRRQGRRKLLQQAEARNIEQTLTGSDMEEKPVPTPVDIMKRKKIARKLM